MVYIFFLIKGESKLLGRQRMRKGRKEKGTRKSRENFIDLLLPLYSYLDHWSSVPVHNTPALLYGSSISSPDPSTYCWETALPLIKNSTDSKFLCQEWNEIHTVISWWYKCILKKERKKEMYTDTAFRILNKIYQ